MANFRAFAIAVAISITPLIAPRPTLAQFADVRQHLNQIPTSRIVFARNTSSTKIENANNHIYILRAKAGQTITIKTLSMGARASVTLYGTNGKPLSHPLGGQQTQEIRLKLPQTGDYYIVGGAGPSNHFYNFTVTIQ